jgi:hypothetical protein
VIQCIRGRTGDDRDAILAVQYRPHFGLAEGPPSALSRGKGRSEDTAGTCDMGPAPKRARVNEAQAQCSHSTVTKEGRSIPLTPENDRGHSDTPDDKRRGPSSVMDSSEYSPVSGVEQEPREVKTEDQADLLRLAQSVQVLTRRRSAT